MKLLITQFFTCGTYEVHPGDHVDFDAERSRHLLDGGFAVEDKPEPSPKPKRKEVKP